MSVKVFPRVERVTTFSAHGVGPQVASVSVMAIVHPSTNYPECRVIVGTLHGSVALTPGQVADLIASLAIARDEVVAACPSLLNEAAS